MAERADVSAARLLFLSALCLKKERGLRAISFIVDPDMAREPVAIGSIT